MRSKSDEKKMVWSGYGHKALKIVRTKFRGRLVRMRSAVRIRIAAPTKVAKKDATPETLAAARVSAVSEDKIEHQTRWRCKRPFS